MKQVWFRFYEELNDFLPSGRRKKLYPWSFTGNIDVKNAIEMQGVPHSEVDLVLVNGEPAEFGYRVRDEDRISVYPVFESMDITGTTKLKDRPLRQSTFIADAHLGKLSKYLRLCGFDTLFAGGLTDKEIIDVSENENRIILTRDRQMLMNSRVRRGYWIRSERPEKQLSEVIGRFCLKDSMKSFTRCLDCNSLLEKTDKEKIIGRLEAGTIRYFNDFWICPSCNHIYWEGSHYERMKKMIGDILLAEQGETGKGGK